MKTSKTKRQYPAAALLLLCSMSAASATQPADTRRDEDALGAQQKQWLEILSEKDATSSENRETGRKATVIKDDYLAAHPQLLENVFAESLNSDSADLVSSLAAIYRKQPVPNPKLLARADALLAKLEGKTSEAVARYRALHDADQSDERILLDLAAAEFQDYRLGAAAAHFEEAARYGLPAPVAANIDRFRKAVKNQTAWQFSGGISPTHTDNANNAAPRYCINLGIQTACSLTTPVSANGLSYELNAEKLTPLYEHHYLKFRANLSGTSYFFDHQSAYDDAFGRIYLGWQRRDGRQTLTVLPFYQAQLAGSDEFDGKPDNDRRAAPYMLAHAPGIQTSHTLNLGNTTQLYYSLESYRQNHREAARAQRSDGRQDSAYVSLARRFGSGTTLFGGWQFGRFVPKNKTVRNIINNNAYNRNSINIGWIQKWRAPGGLNTRLTASFARRSYKGLATFGEEAQRNRERYITASVSHDKLSYKGITPMLSYTDIRIRSNAPYAERRTRQWTIGAEWRF